MADEPQIEIREEPNPRRTVNLRFQKNSTRNLKYLEAEPKILGTTQIVLAFFLTSVVVALLHISEGSAVVTPMNIVAIIAGSLGIAAQNLHPPTIKACLGMQVVTCLAAVITIMFSNLMHPRPIIDCDEEDRYDKMCKSFQFLQHLVMAVQIALSATLAAYCCKVIPFCSPSTDVPVITVERPADAQ